MFPPVASLCDITVDSVAWILDGDMACCCFAEARLRGPGSTQEGPSLSAPHPPSPQPVVPKVTAPREEAAAKSWVSVWRLEGLYSLCPALLQL